MAVEHSSGLPITANAAYSICVWVKGAAGQRDRRVFAEAMSDTTYRNPLFTIGTHSQGDGGSVDVYVRGDNGNEAIGHRRSQQTAFDGTWHHIAWVDDAGDAELYVDGVRDGTDFSYARTQLTAGTTCFGAIAA